MAGLRAIRSSMIKDVRGLGLLIGVDFHPEATTARIGRAAPARASPSR